MADMNFDYKKYLEDLTPEQQEKVRECKTKEELMELLAEEDIEIPMEALENVAGGCGTADRVCPEGGNHSWKKLGFDVEPGYATYQCTKCGRKVVSSGSLDEE